MSYEVVFSMSRPSEVWSVAAVERLVGQRPTVNGAPAEVVEAWQDDDGTVQARLRVEGEAPDFSGVRGYPVGPAVPAGKDGWLGEGVVGLPGQDHVSENRATRSAGEHEPRGSTRPEVRISPDGVWLAWRWPSGWAAGLGWSAESNGGARRDHVADEDVETWTGVRLVTPWEDGRWRRCPVEGCSWDTRGTAAGGGPSLCSPGTGDGSVTGTPGCLIGSPIEPRP